MTPIKLNHGTGQWIHTDSSHCCYRHADLSRRAVDQCHQSNRLSNPQFLPFCSIRAKPESGLVRRSETAVELRENPEPCCRTLRRTPTAPSAVMESFHSVPVGLPSRYSRRRITPPLNGPPPSSTAACCWSR